MKRVSNWIFLLSIFFASLVEYGGDASFKLYATTNSYGWLSLGIFFYILLVCFIIAILKYSNVMQMNIQWDAMSVILETLLAYILLKETLSGYNQYIGFGFIILGMILMNIGESSYN